MSLSKLVPYLKLSNGKLIPGLGLGTWQSPPGQVREAVRYAIVEQGYRHIDCAFIYGNEKEVGQALADVFNSTNLTRKDLFITSKVWNTYHSRARVTECCSKSLANLGLEYLDLYLIHWPSGYQEGEELFPSNGQGGIAYTDVDYIETWQGMEDCLNNGLVQSIGLSNFNSVQIERVLSNCTVKPMMLQVECHPYLNQKQLFEFCKARDVMLTAYSPLGSPARPAASIKPTDPILLEDLRLKEIGKKHSKSAAQVLIRFQIQRGIVVIPKSVTKSRIAENIDVFDFELSDQEMETILSFKEVHRYAALARDITHIHYPFKIPF